MFSTQGTVPWEIIYPPWHFSYFVALKLFWGEFVSFDLHNMPTILKMQNIFKQKIINSM